MPTHTSTPSPTRAQGVRCNILTDGRQLKFGDTSALAFRGCCKGGIWNTEKSFICLPFCMGTFPFFLNQIISNAMSVQLRL